MEATRKVLADRHQSRKQKQEEREHLALPSPQGGEGGGATGDGRVLVTSRGLGVALGVSLRTVERMLAAGEIVPVRIRGMVRFYVPDVVVALRNGERKWGRAADGEKLKAETLKTEIRGGGQ